MMDLCFARRSPQNQLGMRIYLDRLQVMKRKKLLPGTNHLRFKLALKKKSVIHIVFSGRGTAVLGDAILVAHQPIPDRKYVFLFCADTLRADHLPIYGYERDTAPRIAEFAGDAVLFEHAYAPSAWTLPSHMSLFTGLNEYTHGAKRGSSLSIEVPYLIEDISRVAVTRSINGGIFMSSRFGFHRGFDSFFSIARDQTDPLATGKLADLARAELKRSFFASGFFFLHTYQVHTPYNPAQRFLSSLGLDPPQKALSAPIMRSNHRDQFVEFPPSRVQNFIDLYDGEIRALDEGFGKFLDFLKQAGIYDQSLIVFFSDHGEEFYEHKGWEHGHSLYNEIIHVPLIVKFPGNRHAGRKVSTPAGLVDIMPTFLNHYGISLKQKTLDGCSLTELIEGHPRPKPVLASLTSGRYIPALPFKISVIENSRKLIYNLPYTKKTFEFFTTDPPPYQRNEVYDIAIDPGERKNLQSRFGKWIHSFHNLFRNIIAQARAHLKDSGRKVILDKETRDAFKTLGYL